jgi:hypothetical protein
LDQRLIGTWVSDPEDEEGIRELGRATIEFTEDGRLIYVIHGEEKDQKMFLTYSADDGVLVTDQPSEPREERTAYSITSDGRLTLSFGGRRSVYIRGAQ